MHAFNESLRYDKRMHKADINGSIAYAKALVLAGILTKEEEVKIVEGLKVVGREWEEGTVSRALHFLFLKFAKNFIMHTYSSSRIRMMKTFTLRMSDGSLSSSVRLEANCIQDDLATIKSRQICGCGFWTSWRRLGAI
jgi:hypothetical protein